ncbi:O-antigen ligase family protein [Verrucomicrobiota bacterium]
MAHLVALSLPYVRFRLSSLMKEIDPWSGGRMTMWTKVMPGLIKKYPFGVGYGSLTNEEMQEQAEIAWKREYPGKRPRGNLVEKGRTHLHSNIPQVLVETGWIGLFVYIAWMIRAAADGIMLIVKAGKAGLADKIHATTLLLMLLGLFANGMVEYNFGDAELVIILSIVMGVIGRNK